jgi:hypothetical protein
MKKNIVDVAIAIEGYAYSSGKLGEQTSTLSMALFAAELHNADYEDVVEMAKGDEDAFGEFIDQRELGTYVFEHVVDYFQEIAQREQDIRSEDAKDAWEVETELRQLQGAY